MNISQEKNGVVGLRNLRCNGPMFRRGLRWAWDQIESGSGEYCTLFLRWLRLVFLIRLAVCGFAVCGSSKRRWAWNNKSTLSLKRVQPPERLCLRRGCCSADRDWRARSASPLGISHLKIKNWIIFKLNFGENMSGLIVSAFKVCWHVPHPWETVPGTDISFEGVIRIWYKWYFNEVKM